MKKTYLFSSTVLLICYFIFVQSLQARSKHLHKERYYQKIFCDKLNGVQEYRLNHRERIDCITPKLACEVDFAYKVYEATGQSLFYAIEADRHPCVVLIKERYKDSKYIRRARQIARKADIRLYVIYPSGFISIKHR